MGLVKRTPHTSSSPRSSSHSAPPPPLRYWLNVEGFFEDKFKYGSSKGSSYGPVWYGQNTNFDKGDHKHHILASAYACDASRTTQRTPLLPALLLTPRSSFRYAYLDDLWIHGYVSEKAMFPMLEAQMPDVSE